MTVSDQDIERQSDPEALQQAVPEARAPAARERYIIRTSAPVAMRDFLAGLDPDVEIVDQIGPAEEPHTVVVAVTAEQQRALALRAANNQQLTIERDQPLSLFGAETGLPREE